jgi:hypothetical protein
MWVAMRSRNQRSWLMTTAQPAKAPERLFERAQRVDVEVVGRLVEQQHVAAAASASWPDARGCARRRRAADLLLLVAPLKLKAAT